MLAWLSGYDAGASVDEYESQPAREMLFQRRRIGVPPELRKDPSGLFTLRGASSLEDAHAQSEHFEFSVSEMPSFSIDLPPMCLMSITSADTDTHSLNVCSRVRSINQDQASTNQQQASAIVRRASLVREGCALALKAPPDPEGMLTQYYLDVVTPSPLPVTITGSYAAVEIFGISTPVTVSTTHARIWLLNTSGPVNAMAREGGSIVFQGSRGNVHLNADAEIDVEITDSNYVGRLEAIVGGPLRVLLPVGFESPVEANVSSPSCFICRADVCSQVVHRREAGRIAVVANGSGEPTLRFVSHLGKVIIDTPPPRT